MLYLPLFSSSSNILGWLFAFLRGDLRFWPPAGLGQLAFAAPVALNAESALGVVLLQVVSALSLKLTLCLGKVALG